MYLGIMERDNLLYAFLMTNEFTHWILANFVQVFFKELWQLCSNCGNGSVFV